MKKIIALILCGLILAGCSTREKKEQTASANPNSKPIAKKMIQEIPQPTAEKSTQGTPQLAPEEVNKDKDWFIGAIGSAKIHAKLNISGDKVFGFYYYDKYKKNISIDGSIEDGIKNMKTIFLTEDTDKKATIQGLFRSENYIQGMWSNGKESYPMYIIKNSIGVMPPEQASKNTMRFEGYWSGSNSGYFNGSDADIKVLFDDLIFYDLTAFNGSHSGELSSFAIVNNNTAKTVFNDIPYGEEKENVFFEFTVKDKTLSLKSNSYDYMCGMAVYFDSSYTKGKIEVPFPTAKEVGIVDTVEQDGLFKKLVGDDYKGFINYTAGVGYSDAELDGKKVMAGESYLRGLNGYCFYITSPEYIYAAMDVGDKIVYYTNDKSYASRLPQPMADWANKRVALKVEYIFQENKNAE
ncbi:MAG: hypothetical protein ACM3UU_06660 [Ignavibacteriales bacterium]